MRPKATTAAMANATGRAFNERNIFILQRASFGVRRKVCQQLVRIIRRYSVEARCPSLA